MSYAIVGLLFLLADQLLKFWTVTHVELNAYPGVELLPGVMNLTYIKNPGIAFGLFGEMAALRWILLVLLVLFTAFIVVSLVKGYLRTGFARWTGVLLLVGLLGNGVDRAVYGYVVDMLEPKLGSISWPIFNIADALILIFGILFCIAMLTGGFGKPRRKKKKSAARKVHGEGTAPANRRKHSEGAARTAHPKAEGERTHSARREGAEHPVRREAPAEEAKAAPKAERPVRVTPSEAAETLRRQGSAMRPAPEEPVNAPVSAEEAEPVKTVERPAPKPEAAPGAESAPEASEVPEAPVSREKPSIEDMDLDSILAEFK